MSRALADGQVEVEISQPCPRRGHETLARHIQRTTDDLITAGAL